jgi:tetratricopeptide (TPR) repeat protein
MKLAARRPNRKQRRAHAAPATLAEAMRHHRAGHLPDAERLYREFLCTHPGHADALHLLGSLACQTGRSPMALDLIAQAIARDGRNPAYHNNLGIALAQTGAFDAAAASYRRALALRPDYPEAHNNLGAALAKLGRPAEAVNSYRRALALRPQDAGALSNLGCALADSGEPEAAIQVFREALALRPDFADALNNLGNALRDLGLFPQAEEAFERALAQAPHGRIYYNLAELTRFARGDARLVAMENFARHAMDQDSRIALHFALARAYDDCGAHPRAFAELRDGHALQRRTIAYDEAGMLALMERIAARFDAGLFETLRGQGDPSSIPVFILGMPRSGSTLVEQILASHPAVFGAGERRDFGALARTIGEGTLERPEVLRLAITYLAGLRARAPDALRITDKTTTNFLHAGLIHLAFPQARIIHTRRAAIDTTWSCFTRLFRDAHPYAHDLGELGRYYRGYDRLMAHWRRVLPESVFLEIDYEALIGDPEGQIRRLLAHCGLDWNPACLAFHTTRRAVQSASAVQVREPLHARSIGRWRAYGEYLQPLVDALEGRGPTA